MRQAALKAGLISDTPEGHGRISFVTEGEASLHFAIENGVLSQAMEVRKLFRTYQQYFTFSKRVKALLSLMLAGERLMLALTSELLRRGREFLKRLPRHNVRREFHSPRTDFLTSFTGYFHGSVFVTFKAKDFLKGLLHYFYILYIEKFLDLLTESTFADDLDHVCSCFDKTTKPRFRNAEDPQYIKFGATRDNDPTCGIRFGQLKLAG